MTRPRTQWQQFDHEADIGVRGMGATEAQAFEQAALAMTSAVTPLENIRRSYGVKIRCHDDDPEVLLVDWLNAVIFEMATRTMLFGRYEVAINHGRLVATAWGEAIDPKRHQPAVEIKGATYTALRVGQRADGLWVAQTVVDV